MSEQQNAPANVPGETQAPVTSGKSGLLSRKRPAHRKVTLPASESRETAHEQYVAALSPLQMAEIGQRTFKYVADPDRPGEVKAEADGKRSFYMIAKALRDPDGSPTYKGDAYVLGAEQVGQMLDQSEIDLLLDAVNDVSGMSKKKRDEVGKDSAGIPSIG